MKFSSSKNYGYGRQIGYAVGGILREKYGQGRFGTRHTMMSRLNHFCEYLCSLKVRDLSEVRRRHIVDYAQMLRMFVLDESLSISTAVNRLSATNVLFSQLRNDKELWLSPADFIGKRSYIANEAPRSLDPSRVLAASHELLRQGDLRLATAIELCRFTGSRIKEASLVDLKLAAKTSLSIGELRIQNGTKGGRGKKIARVIRVEDHLAKLISSAASKLDDPNLIPAGMHYDNWYQSIYRAWQPVAHKYSLGNGFHDLRSGYACERYKQITGFEAPCVTGIKFASRTLDELARGVIAKELGHGRIDVTASYVGSKR